MYYTFIVIFWIAFKSRLGIKGSLKYIFVFVDSNNVFIVLIAISVFCFKYGLYGGWFQSFFILFLKCTSTYIWKCCITLMKSKTKFKKTLQYICMYFVVMLMLIKNLKKCKRTSFNGMFIFTSDGGW